MAPLFVWLCSEPTEAGNFALDKFGAENASAFRLCLDDVTRILWKNVDCECCSKHRIAHCNPSLSALFFKKPGSSEEHRLDVPRLVASPELWVRVLNRLAEWTPKHWFPRNHSFGQMRRAGTEDDERCVDADGQCRNVDNLWFLAPETENALRWIRSFLATDAPKPPLAPGMAEISVSRTGDFIYQPHVKMELPSLPIQQES